MEGGERGLVKTEGSGEGWSAGLPLNGSVKPISWPREEPQIRPQVSHMEALVDSPRQLPTIHSEIEKLKSSF